MMPKSKLSFKIDEHIEQDNASFHSPAHAGKLDPRDLTELDGLDDLQDPQGVLKESQELVAQIFGASKSLFMTGGASLGNQAACLALKMYLEKNQNKLPVLVSRNVHKSVLAGIIISGLEIEWIEPEWNGELGLFTRVKLPESSGTSFPLMNSYNDSLETKYSAVILTNPSYEGFYSEIPKLNIPVIIDEAHGAHYHFSDHLPKPALDYGADVVVQSWHKTLGSLTQTGVLHVSKFSKIPENFVVSALRLLQSTSPSYLLLESICKVAELYKTQGRDIIANTINLANRIPKEFLAENDDPTRLLIKAKNIEEDLAKYKINIEHSNNNYGLAIINPGNSLKEVHTLEKALEEIQPKANQNYISKPKFLEQRTNMREAFLKADTNIEAPCPPGIALRAPGQC